MSVKILNNFIPVSLLSLSLILTSTAFAETNAPKPYRHNVTFAINDLIYWKKYFGVHGTHLKWKNSNGKSATVSYALDLSSWNYGLTGNTIKQPHPLSERDKKIARKALELWSNVGNIQFVEKKANRTDPENNVDIVIRQTHFTGNMKNYLGLALPYADFGGDEHRIIKADVLIANPHPIVMVHEVGHALGLDHAEGDNNNPEYSIMHDKHRNDFKVLPLTPMVNDIAAIQTIYGANQTYLKDNSLHMYRGGSKKQDKLYGYTIWDGGGVDTLTSIMYPEDVSLDLREGTKYYSNIGQQRIWIAYGAQIENAITGYGNDTIVGNNLSNLLDAGSGNDLITGYSGQDKLVGGSGNDTFAFVHISDSSKNSPDEIVDFKSGQDKIKFLKTTGIHNFEQLDIKSSNSQQNTYVTSHDGKLSILLRGQQNLSPTDFIFE